MPFGAQDGGGGNHLDPCAPRGIGEGAHDFRAQVRNGLDNDTRGFEVEGALIGLVARGDDDGTFADTHAVAIQISMRGAREHDSGPIVARKYQRPLDGAGGEHHSVRANLPQPLAWLAWRWPARWSVSRSFRPMRLCGK